MDLLQQLEEPPRSSWRRNVEQSLFQQFYPSVPSRTFQSHSNRNELITTELTQKQSQPITDTEKIGEKYLQQQQLQQPDSDSYDKKEMIQQKDTHLAVTFLHKETKLSQEDIENLLTVVLASLRKVSIDNNPPIRNVVRSPPRQPKVIKTRKIPRRTILSDLQDNYDLDDDEFDLLLMDLQFPSMLDEEYTVDDEYDTEVSPEHEVSQMIFPMDEETDDDDEDDNTPEKEEEINAFLVASSAPESWYTPTSEDVEYDEFDSFEKLFFDNDTILHVGEIIETHNDADIITLKRDDVVATPILDWKIHHSQTLSPTMRPLPPPLEDDDDDDGSYNALEIQMLEETEFPLEIEMDWVNEEEDDMDEYDYKVLQDSVLTISASLKDREHELFLDSDVSYNDDECTDVEIDITMDVVPTAEILKVDNEVILSDELQSHRIPQLAEWPASPFTKRNGYSQPLAMTRPPPPNDDVLPRPDHTLLSRPHSAIPPPPPIIPPPLHPPPGCQDIPARLVGMNQPPKMILPLPPPLPRPSFSGLSVGNIPPPTVRPPLPLNRYQLPKRQMSIVPPPPPPVLPDRSSERPRDNYEQYSR